MPSLFSSWYSTQHLYMEWSCNKTEIFANINLAIVATYVEFAQDRKKNNPYFTSYINIPFYVQVYLLHVIRQHFRAEYVKMIYWILLMSQLCYKINRLYEIDIFSDKLNNAHSWSSISEKKNVDYIVKKLKSAQSFLFMIFNSTPLHGVKL